MIDKKNKKIRIGSGAGYSGDRIEPALQLAKKGELDYLVFECLAERTIALAQQRKSLNPKMGYDPLLEERMYMCLPACIQNGVKIITNMGAANPVSAMEKVIEVAKNLGLKKLKVAAITGDEVLTFVQKNDYELLETKKTMSSLGNSIISANAYIGASAAVEALENGADIVITGRFSDPSLFIAPLVYEFSWSFNDYELLGKGTILGHLMECGGHITGGYFADPGYKDVPDLANLGFPIAEVTSQGSFTISKLPNAGGMVTTATCKEQLLYEIHDPKNYLTPDVIADFSEVTFKEVEKNKIEVIGGKGKEKTGKLKVSIGYEDGFIGEGQISYGGPGAIERAQLAISILKTRISTYLPEVKEVRFDCIGQNSLYGNTKLDINPYEIRVRVAARTSTRKEAIKIGNEVEALYTNGPAGGGGVFKNVQKVVAIQSILIKETLVQPEVHYKSL
ncbi:hypothetical protein GGR42_000652 [Saonia flava]|uniref:Acyclic terpene utilisation N-terminal domain-containing protein n=1 Tax=Saonia flava TaxID=523696 RepID=A0A846QTA3_9FLAO|nr:acyclic terpene utilization AtuA family protein [Saonia flava]NJB70190.1 hypothetical protein [Saonia flava]